MSARATKQAPHAAPVFALTSEPPAGARIAFAALNTWVRAAARCRVNINPLLVKAGLSIDETGVPTICRQGLVELMESCVAQAAPHAHFPLLVAESFAFDHLPAMDTFLNTSPNLRLAMRALDWVSVILGDFQLGLQEVGDEAILSVSLPNKDLGLLAAPQTFGHFVELILACVCKVVPILFGHKRFAARLEFMHDPGPVRADWQAQFGLPMSVHSSRNALVFERALLDMPLPGAVPALHTAAGHIVEHQLPTAGARSLSRQIEGLFLRQPEQLGQGIASIAAALHLHPRTLQRRLRQENAVFAAIQAQCRQEAALALLSRGDLDIETIAHRLGFADRQSFTRAFKRWTGVSPRSHRKLQQA